MPRPLPCLERVMHVEGPAMGMDVLSRSNGNVIPAHAGIQCRGNGLDSRVRGNDHLAIIWHVCFPEYITRSRHVSVSRRCPVSPAQQSVPNGAEWFLMLPGGDPRDKRVIFQVLPPGAEAPTVVLKVAHFESQLAPLDDLERGLAVAMEIGGVIYDHRSGRGVPQLSPSEL